MAVRRTYRDIGGGRRQAGFTLVELLVAMTLLAFLSLTLFGGLRFGARSWEVVVDSSAERDRIATTQTFLRDRLGQLTLPGPAGRQAAQEKCLASVREWRALLRLELDAELQRLAEANRDSDLLILERVQYTQFGVWRLRNERRDAFLAGD